MSYLGFQWAALKAFMHGRTEADYADKKIWISDDIDLEPVAEADNVGNPLGIKLED